MLMPTLLAMTVLLECATVGHRGYSPKDPMDSRGRYQLCHFPAGEGANRGTGFSRKDSEVRIQDSGFRIQIRAGHESHESSRIVFVFIRAIRGCSLPESRPSAITGLRGSVRSISRPS